MGRGHRSLVLRTYGMYRRVLTVLSYVVLYVQPPFRGRCVALYRIMPYSSILKGVHRVFPTKIREGGRLKGGALAPTLSCMCDNLLATEDVMLFFRLTDFPTFFNNDT